MSDDKTKVFSAMRARTQENIARQKAAEHTPTTDGIRHAFMVQSKIAGGTFEQGLAEFDRWLAAHDVAVRADMQPREVRTVEWEYGTSVPALGDKPGSETYPTLESALAVQRESATTYKKWTHGNPVSVWRRTPAGPWHPVTPSTPNQQGAEQ